MLKQISENSKKTIGWFFLIIFYLQLISPVFAGQKQIAFGYSPMHSVDLNYGYKISNKNVLPNYMAPYELEKRYNLKNTESFTRKHLNEKNKLPETKTKIHSAEDLAYGPGPSQPEMQSFQSVNSNNMVDLFTGDFSYNIPLLDVGGYPVNLHYSSGITMDQESSWVGLGWNINPGTISRNMRGLPDDFNGTDSIKKIFNMKANRTVGLTIGGNAELFGKTTKSKVEDKKDSVKGRLNSLGISLGIFHNNYNGWGTETSINTGINSGTGSKGHLSGGLSITNNSQSGLDVSPSFSIRMGKEDAKMKGFTTVGTNYNSRIGVQSLQMTTEVRTSVVQRKNEERAEKKYYSTSGISSGISFATPSFTPSITVPFTSKQFSFTAKVGSEKWAYHPNFYVQGNYSTQYIDEKDMVSSLPAYGYLYFQESENSDKVLLDFNREKEVAFRGSTPHIAIPGYTYDIYSVTGEGTGGMFRPYRGDIGMIYDHAMSTKSGSDKLSLDLGFGSVLHVGLDINKVWANSKNNAWLTDNVISSYVGFKNQDSLYENVYFKNPGEKVSVDQAFYDKIGDDKLVRVELSPVNGQNAPIVSATRNLTMFQNAKKIGNKTLDASVYKSSRDKRTQVISYLTAKDAAIAGLDKKIISYGINSFPTASCVKNYTELDRVGEYRKKSHLSEITVLGADGKRYVYGLPAYNIEQQDVSFAVDKTGGDNNAGLVTYDTLSDNSVFNKKGKDNFFSEEIIPSYAHSFLLSGIVSSDYVDITNDGITEDDNGDAVKFNYSRVYGGSNPYKWRAPFAQNKAAYNEGFKTNSRDDKGSYSYGQKEIWYMNSIESKTMMATFVLETDSIRQDSYGVKGPNGGLASGQKSYRLKEINLYTKADILKNGVQNAKPIKTVHFEYSYEICLGVPSSNDTGKLTLKKVWFTYNKNPKGKLNPYNFKYHSTNPSFDNKSYDRWGNFKNPDLNPGASGNTLTNGEYPYTLQNGVKNWDSTQAANSVAAWTLNEIKLPSGGVMKISYESDDYAYVQNRRAMQMFALEGLGNDSTATPSGFLYKANEKRKDFSYVFIKLKNPVLSKKEIEAKYLDGVKKLYFKMFVKMPDTKDGDRWGTGYEQIPCFADIENFGIKPGSDNKTIWLKIANLKEGRTPLATAAIQYLRLNHPDKAFPYSEPGDDVKLKDVIGMIASAAANVKNSIDGFEDQARASDRCNKIDPEKSFVRLNNPEFRKFGGGLRVKKIELFDNWQKMTNQSEATYGQTYDYSTIKNVNSADISISSGVCTYEPALGKEENPFYQPIEYAEKMAAFGPTDFLFTEEPLGESFFPSPSVGYSKVSVQTINKSKKSANGIDITEFFTAKEFPTIFENTILDDESKKSFANPIGNFFKFDAKRYITLSQGFKIELNDMHGKVKAQHSFAQTDLLHPFSSTFNYYKLDNDNSLNKHLSNNVNTIDSTNGRLNKNAVMGKDIDMLIDIREQTSKTVSASVQLNVDIAKVAPPIIIPSIPKLPTFETNRYRSIAVTKIINRYGILDSVVHFDKGSKVSTSNMVYDGETGNVLLSRTQNEFDDLLYSFNYPAYWAYGGMGNAYKNIGGVFNDVLILNGKMSYRDLTPVDLRRYFESGDEILLYGKISQTANNPLCLSADFNGYSDTALVIWAIEMGKSSGGNQGIYFIDKEGKPVTASASVLKIVRSGRRNLLNASAGSIMSLQNPIISVNGIDRIVFDSLSRVIATNALVYKDLWKVDSSSYRKDTVLMKSVLIQPQSVSISAIDLKGINAHKTNSSIFNICPSFKYSLSSSNISNFTSYTEGNGNNTCTRTQNRYKSSILFGSFENVIPPNSVVTQALLFIQSPKDQIQMWQRGNDNSAYISRPLGLSMQDYAAIGGNLQDAYFNSNLMKVDNPSRLYISATLPKGSLANEYYINFNVENLVQGMVDNYYASNKKNRPSLVIDQKFNTEYGEYRNEMGFGYESCNTGKYVAYGSECRPRLSITFIPPCSSGLGANYSPELGYYCNSQPYDTFFCKSNFSDISVNPYRWGIWGNWRNDKSYTYYNVRKESDPDVATNIRKDGEIKNFTPYWFFTNSSLLPSQDTLRWVWNSEMNLVNSKGLELQNRDALDRYNSAQYGYNQTLPVAVAQNSKNREMVFEGFEDYGYRTDTCKSCPPNRFINMIAGGNLVDTISHTGTYSLRVAGNQTNSVIIPVISNTQDTISANVVGTVSTNTISQTVVTGTGTGLNAKYSSLLLGSASLYRTDSTINFDWGQNAIYNNNKNFVNIVWTGWIQPRYSEEYTFFGTADDNMKVYVNGIRISANTRLENQVSNELPLRKITLNAGQMYSIRVEYTELKGFAKAKLQWESPSQRKEVIPKQNLYTVNSPGPVTTQNVVCQKLDNIQGTNITLNNFSSLQNSKLVVGAWVKEKNNNADTVTNYRNVQMQIVFNNGTTFTLKPTGFIIEGWQRIEEVITVPANASQMTINLMSTDSGVPVYFDDIRLHPFNSILKSYVYSPINLRLVAELDENNFASFYEYDDDGTLVRTKKETERGIKTIKETRSALLKE